MNHQQGVGRSSQVGTKEGGLLESIDGAMVVKLAPAFRMVQRKVATLGRSLCETVVNLDF